MKLIYCFLIVLCPLISIAQTAPALKPLSIGDNMPSMILNNLVNTPYNSTSLAAQSTELLLLDFWATNCSSCIKEFPKLDSLQAMFNGRLHVLLVNEPRSGDNEKKVESFFEKKRNPAGKRYALSVVLNDSYLAQLFPHNTIPHTVWIYKGKFYAVTEADECNASNIEALFAGRNPVMESKIDQFDFNNRMPLLENGNGGSSAALLYRSMFTRYLKGAGAAVGQVIGPDSLTRRKYYINKAILSLYGFAFPKLPTNRIIIDSSLYPLLLTNNLNSKWEHEHSFCYEQTLPFNISRTEQLHAMQFDLDRQFGLYSRLEKRPVDCFVLTVKDAALLNKIKTGGSGSLDKNDAGYWILRNTRLAELVKEINYQPPLRPFIPIVLDETGYSLPVDMDLQLKNIHDIASLQKILPAFGLEITPAVREIEMLLISPLIINKN